jgi:hypothetical protein
MFARIFTIIAKDLRTATRDQLTLYILASPILLGLLLVLIVPIFEEAAPQFVTTAELTSVDRDALAAHGELEIVADRAALEARVRGRDDATGVLPLGSPARAGEVEIVIQGNEPEPLRGLAGAILEYEHERRQGNEALAKLELGGPTNEQGLDIRLAATALLAYTVPALIGLMLGFSILEEKTTNTRMIYLVSPLRFIEYLLAKLGLLLVVAMVLVVPAIAIPLGFDVDWLGVELMVLASLPFAACYGLLIGVFARDQLGAVALTKALSPVWTSLPILGFVLPKRWMWTQFPFANHWGVQGLFGVLGGGGELGAHAGLALATGLPVLVITAVLLRSRLGFGAGHANPGNTREIPPAGGKAASRASPQAPPA